MFCRIIYVMSSPLSWTRPGAGACFDRPEPRGWGGLLRLICLPARHHRAGFSAARKYFLVSTRPRCMVMIKSPALCALTQNWGSGAVYPVGCRTGVAAGQNQLGRGGRACSPISDLAICSDPGWSFLLDRCSFAVPTKHCRPFFVERKYFFTTPCQDEAHYVKCLVDMDTTNGEKTFP